MQYRSTVAIQVGRNMKKEEIGQKKEERGKMEIKLKGSNRFLKGIFSPIFGLYFRVYKIKAVPVLVLSVGLLMLVPEILKSKF